MCFDYRSCVSDGRPGGCHRSRCRGTWSRRTCTTTGGCPTTTSCRLTAQSTGPRPRWRCRRSDTKACGMFELAATDTPRRVLERAQSHAAGSNDSCRCRDVAYIQDIAKHEGEQVTIQGWLYNRRSSGKIHFLQVRDGSGFIQAVMSKASVGEEAFKQADHLSQETSLSVTGTVRADARAPRRLRDRRGQPRGPSRGARLPHHAEGTRRRLPAGSPTPLDPLAAPAGDPARASRGDQRRPRLLQPARLHPV